VVFFIGVVAGMGDVKVNGKRKPKPTSHQKRLKLKNVHGSKWHGRATLLPRRLEVPSFARFESSSIPVGFLAFW